jgi:hypothetical protein
MGILAPLYIKLESTAQGEMDIQPEGSEETMYGVDIVYSIWTDESRKHLVARINKRFDNIPLSGLTFQNVYSMLMCLYPNSTFVE